MSENKITIDQDLDVTGHLCPIPVLKAKKALTSMQASEILRVRSSDPGSMTDFPHFCNNQGHDLISSDQVQDEYHFIIRKSA